MLSENSRRYLMEIIDYNPANKVPKFSEKDFILSVHESDSTRFVDHIRYNSRSNRYALFGNAYAYYTKNNYYHLGHFWTENEGACSQTKLDFLIKDAKCMEERNWQYKYYVIENKKELLDVLDSIPVYGPLREEFLGLLPAAADPNNLFR